MQVLPLLLELALVQAVSLLLFGVLDSQLVLAFRLVLGQFELYSVLAQEFLRAQQVFCGIRSFV